MIHIEKKPVKTYLSKSKISGFDYVINPYIGCPHKCIYCYAEYMRRFTGHTEEWGEFLDVKTCPIPLRPAQLFRTRVMLSSVTDPYNPYEKQYELTRKLLTQLSISQSRVFIITKSPLVVRDIDLLKKMFQCEVCFSFSGIDEKFRQAVEKGAAPISERIEALKTLHQAGIGTAVMCAPLFPEITDWKSLVSATRPFTDSYTFDSLNLRPGYQKKVLTFIETNYPDLLPLYCDIYLQEKWEYWEKLREEISCYCQAEQIPAEILFSGKSPEQIL